MEHADSIIFGTLIVLTLIVVLLSRWAFRQARAQESASAGWDAARVASLAGPKLLPGPWLWGRWSGRAKLDGLCLELLDAQGLRLCQVRRHALLQRGGVRDSLELQGRRYETVNASMFSGRTLLREAATGEVQFSADCATFAVHIYRGTGEELVCSLRHGSVFQPYSTVLAGGAEVGRLFTVWEGHGSAQVLSVNAQASIPVLAQCFVYLCLPSA